MQEQMEDLLTDYVASQPHLSDRVTGELLLRLSEIERLCLLIREEVTVRKSAGRLGRFPLLMELFQEKPSWLYWQLTGCKNSAANNNSLAATDTDFDMTCNFEDVIDVNEVDGIDNDAWENLITEYKLEFWHVYRVVLDKNYTLKKSYFSVSERQS